MGYLLVDWCLGVLLWELADSLAEKDYIVQIVAVGVCEIGKMTLIVSVFLE